MIMTLEPILATRDSIDAVVEALKPLRGGLWLVVDRATRCHWVIEADAVHPARGGRYGRSMATIGLATVTSSEGRPVFMVEARDELNWTLPGETLKVREGRNNGSEIVLHRLDDAGAPTISGEAINRRLAAGDVAHAVRVTERRYIEIDDCLLPTGDIALDAELQIIEAAVRAQLTARATTPGAREALAKLQRHLDKIARDPRVESFVWIISLRELLGRIADAR